MKLTSVILSLVFLILSCLPCADLKVNNSAHITTEFTSNHEKHSTDNHNDLCSPFCICSCCGSVIASYSHPIIIKTPIRSKVIKAQLPTYKSILHSNFYGSIWQPPKIA